MSYRKSWTKTFEAHEFITFDCAPIWGCPEPCPLHEPYCYKAPASAGTDKTGTMKLLDLLNIKSIMPGVKQKLLKLSVYSMITDYGYWYSAAAWIRLVADTAEIFKRDIFHSGNEWRLNEFSLDKDVSTVNLLDVQFREDCAGYFPGWVTLHCAQIKLEGEYYSVTPPVKASVKLTVSNSKTSALVKGAYVALMSGTRIVADGYTDGGEVVFKNIDEGSYTVKVVAGGYYDFEQSIDVAPPSVWYVIKIVPIPVTPLPTWVWYAVGGVAALGAITVIPSVIRRKPEEKVIVLGR
jgi:hypothetical protein